MESRLRHDFGDVRVHSDAAAAAMARSLRAQAFTSGRDIYFAAGRYEPHSSAGQTLLAHELTHVVQQSGVSGPGPAPPVAGEAHKLLEQEANRFAEGPTDDAPEPLRMHASGPAVQAKADAALQDYLAGLSDDDLYTEWERATVEAANASPATLEAMAVQEHLQAVSDELIRRGLPPWSPPVEKQGETMAELLLRWHHAGWLDPPYRPPDVPPIPLLEPSEEVARTEMPVHPPGVVGGLVAPVPRPAPEVVAPVPRPALRPVPEPAPVTPRATPTTEPPTGGAPGLPRWAGPVAAFAWTFFTPSSIAPEGPPWTYHANPITRKPYSSREEYDWFGRLTPSQIEFLRRIAESPGPLAESLPAPEKKEEEEKKSKCARLDPRAIPIRWPEPLWHYEVGVNDPGSEDAVYDLPHSPLLIKAGTTYYDPTRSEIGRYLRRIANPPFRVTAPPGWPVHHKWPLYLGGDAAAPHEGEYEADGRITHPPNLVIFSPGGHSAWHRYLTEQPQGPLPGAGPRPRTADGTRFCVLDLI